jgi:hypothetical protein
MALVATREARSVQDEMRALEAKVASLLSPGFVVTKQHRPPPGFELKAFRVPQEAFEKQLDAEATFDRALYMVIPDNNNMRMIEAQTLKDFCELRIKRLKVTIEFIEAMLDPHS